MEFTIRIAVYFLFLFVNDGLHIPHISKIIIILHTFIVLQSWLLNVYQHGGPMTWCAPTVVPFCKI